MKTIYPAYKTVSAVCGYQKNLQGATRLTRHCLRIPCPEGKLFYHTLTGELILLETGENVDQCRTELIRHRFLVPEDFNDTEYADQVRNTLNLIKQETSLKSCLIFTTTDCNARCFYCYEMGRKRQNMSEQTAHDVADYIIRHRGNETLTLAWFGGEPLFNKSVIDIITRDLTDAGVVFRSRMTSNGYLFDEELVKIAKEKWNLGIIQITLDGTEEVYNNTKAFIYRDGSAYQRVMRNIGLLLDAGIYVQIRLNMDAKNYEDLMNLADILSERFSDRENFRVYVAVLQGRGAINKFETQDELLQKYRQLYKKLKRNGLTGQKYLLTKFRLNACMADDDGHVTILPDGRLGKCEHETEKELIGSIYVDTIDSNIIASWKERIRVPMCKTCPYYPICQFLKKCDWQNEECTELDRALTYMRLEERILNTYERENNHAMTPDTDTIPETLC